jgi:hypothetical protein
MKVSDIQRLEHSNFNCCYLVKDGIFWRAWEKSAMLFVENIKTYQVTRKQYKGIKTTMVYIGFPDSNLNPIIEKCKSLDLLIERSDDLIKISGFGIQNGYEEWKTKIEGILPAVAENSTDYGLKEKNKKTHDFTSLEEKIRHFPIASKTPMDCQQFLYELQNQINGTL